MFKTKLFSVLLAFLVLLLPVLTACGGDDPIPAPPTMADLDFSDVALERFEDTSETTNYVKLEIANYGTIVIRLFPEVAPITVANFQKLVGQGFYDGLIFHRVIKDFMIQGGDPKGNGTGGSGTDIKGEFALNQVTNNLQHIRGVVSMARSGHPYERYLTSGYTYDDLGLPYEFFEPYYNSASSQFFIMHKTTPHLDGSYASFGYVVYGMDVVDAIASVSTDSNDKPTSTVTITSASFVKLK